MLCGVVWLDSGKGKEFFSEDLCFHSYDIRQDTEPLHFLNCKVRVLIILVQLLYRVQVYKSNR